MFSELLHILGLCPDSLGHFNLTNLASIQIHEVVHIVNHLKLRLWKINKILLFRK